MDQDKPYFDGQPPEKHKHPPTAPIDAVSLRKAVSESLQPVLTALPAKIAEQIAKGIEKVSVNQTYTIDSKELAKALGSELRLLPKPAVTVNNPDTIKLDKTTIEALQQDDELSKSIGRVVDEFQKANKSDPTSALRALVEEMTKNPKLWLNVRFTDGQKFLDKIGETIMVGMGGANVAKDATLRAIQTLLTPATITRKTVAFSLSATGTIIPAVTGKRIKVYAYKYSTSAQSAAGFRNGASTMIEGQSPMAQYGGFVESTVPPNFLFATDVGASLDMLVTTSGVAGRVSYWDDDAS